MAAEIRIAIVDDHALFRKGLCMLINVMSRYRVVFDAENGKDFISKLKPDDLPDIVLLDIRMPVMDGYETATWLRKNHPEIKALALSTMDSETAIIKMIKCGAKGYVLKDTDPEELTHAFNEVLGMGYYFNDLVSKKIVRSVNQLVDDETPINKLLNLSDREVEFLKLACSERSYQQIADEMFVSERSVDGYRESLFRKLGVSTRVGLVMYAIRNGFDTP